MLPDAVMTAALQQLLYAYVPASMSVLPKKILDHVTYKQLVVASW